MSEGVTDHGVRRARSADATRVDRIVRVAHGSGAWRTIGSTAAEVLSRPEHRVYLATAGGRAVGCLIASSPEFTMLHSLSVLRPHRGRNHAAAMIRAAVGDAGGDWGLSGMIATVGEDDRAGRDRFTRLGFRQIPHFLRDGLILLQLTMPACPAQAAPMRQAPRARDAGTTRAALAG